MSITPYSSISPHRLQPPACLPLIYKFYFFLFSTCYVEEIGVGTMTNILISWELRVAAQDISGIMGIISVETRDDGGY